MLSHDITMKEKEFQEYVDITKYIYKPPIIEMIDVLFSAIPV